MSEIEPLLDEYQDQPPPYSPGTLKPWQRRWNREWLHDAWMVHCRRLLRAVQRDCKRTEHNKRHARAWFEEWVSRGRQSGATDERDTFVRSKWQRIKERFFWRLEDEYDAFIQWRRDRKERHKLFKITAVMEDVGDNPKWRGEMTFKFTLEQWLEVENSRQWFGFPSPENIKWFWFKGPATAYDYLIPPSVEHWGPYFLDPTARPVIPFYQAQGRVIRNPEPAVSDHDFWLNFNEPTREVA
ncbi:hypothetical protein F5Y06DRAFT_300857 [Hypoxylon sp. FL0890]|nr:hypothetical protein F5Y06DRAFT_300857 [Hypoxylon sp. FL0890]